MSVNTLGRSVEEFLRIPQVQRRLGLSRSTIYRLVAMGQLEPPLHITERCVGWPATTIQQFIDGRIAAAGRDPKCMVHTETGVRLGEAAASI